VVVNLIRKKSLRLFFHSSIHQPHFHDNQKYQFPRRTITTTTAAAVAAAAVAAAAAAAAAGNPSCPPISNKQPIT
jgi:hypothetical protein